ncbi:MAG: hypothetical protein AVDCRST_MAG11-338, partial [uncultured Gemmatimonadaceae bacterium]
CRRDQGYGAPAGAPAARRRGAHAGDRAAATRSAPPAGAPPRSP